MIDWAPKNTDKAVVLACDEAYLPFASLLAWQIASKTGPRDFDIVIASEEKLILPEVLLGYGVQSEVVELDSKLLSLPVHTLPRSAYIRLQLPSHFRTRYRRLLYLDCDIQFEGGDLSRLLDLDLGGAALGAVRDIMYIYISTFYAPEFKTVGLPAETYFNSGVLLVETAEWVRTSMLERCAALAAQRQDFYRMQDQSVLNVALAGEIAELCPVWNWMMADGHDPIARQMPVMFNHFIGREKPYRPPGLHLDRRYREIYRDFFLKFQPDWLIELPPPGKIQPVCDRRYDLSRYILHLRRRKAIQTYLAPFRDEWTVLPAQRPPGMGGLRT